MAYNKDLVHAAVEAMQKLDANERDVVIFTLEREAGRRKRKPKETPLLDSAEAKGDEKTE